MDRIKAALRRGDVLAAYDLALKALADSPEDLELRYLSVLALTRSGATDFAETRYRELGLEAVAATDHLGIDIAALAGRIAKDRAIAATDPDERHACLHRAIDAYARTSERTDDPYPLINAATLRLWAGDPDGACRAAAEVLSRLAAVPAERRDYWYFATSAEARLLTGDVTAAREHILAAAARSGTGSDRDWQALAVTASQLRRSCRACGADESILAPLRVPPVIVYAGSTAERPDPGGEPGLAATIRAALAERESWIFFGGLAAGFEIMLAEAVIARGAELNVVLPFPEDIFVERVIRPHGVDWFRRFQACFGRAASVRYADDHGNAGRVAPVFYAERLAMGYASLRARPLHTPAVMLVGANARAGGGTASDAAASWSDTGREVVMLGDGACDRGARRAAPDRPADCLDVATLFGDFVGFGTLPEHLVTDYADRLLGGIADILDRHGTDVIFRNSWGDAVVAQFQDVRLAARCAIDIQTFLKQPRIACLAPGVEMRMRVGLHYGPVQRVFDRVQKRTSYMGAHVVRAARIEPVAIPGMIYVSEPFAAALAVDRRNDLACDYLGILESAKSFGRMPLYALREGV